jgi:CheY-like chemotaxis protein
VIDEERGRRIHLLLVEDSEVDVEVMRSSVGRSRFHLALEVSRSGEEALERLERPDPPVDLVLLDLNLPGMTGLDLLAVLKSHPERRRIPVVVMTSSTAETDLLRAYDLHANAFIRKPFGLAENDRLLEVVCSFWIGLVRLAPPPEG